MKWWQNSLISTLTSTILLNLPAQALMVNLTPLKPQQGDTISVIIETDVNTPELKVTSGDQDYPVFPMNKTEGRYRAFIPTTPLDPFGKLVIQVGDGEEVKNMAMKCKYTIQ